jgi:hypothetical protein
MQITCKSSLQTHPDIEWVTDTVCQALWPVTTCSFLHAYTTTYAILTHSVYQLLKEWWTYMYTIEIFTSRALQWRIMGPDTLTFGRVIALYFSRFCPAKLVGFVNMTRQLHHEWILWFSRLFERNGRRRPATLAGQLPKEPVNVCRIMFFYDMSVCPFSVYNKKSIFILSTYIHTYVWYARMYVCVYAYIQCMHVSFCVYVWVTAIATVTGPSQTSRARSWPAATSLGLRD